VTPAFILDASVAIAGLAPDEAHENSRKLIVRAVTEGAVVPALWPFEVGNILAMKFRRGLISAQSLDLALSSIKDFRVLIETVDPHSPSFDATLVLAKETRLTVYDAAYLELALRRAASLATLDEALAKAARARGIVLI
jgi:predicted nucleic acid-binding protein